MVIKEINISIDDCIKGAYIRWFFNGWHYELFSNRFTTSENSSVNGVQVIERFSSISKKEINTARENKIYLVAGKTNIKSDELIAYKGLLIAENVELFQVDEWVKLEIIRTSFTVRQTKLNVFKIEFNALVNLTHPELLIQENE